MSDKQPIFVSSVQKEFAAERRALKDFVQADPLLKRFFEVFLFEDIPAAGRRADQVYLAEVDRAAVYVALLGKDYGYEDAEGVSPTEREFDRAATQGKERLVYLAGQDDNARHPKMRAFIRKAGDQLIRRRFASIPELIAALYASLVEHLERSGALRTGPFDATACPGAALDDLSEEKLADFLDRARQQRGYALSAGTAMDKALAHLNLLDRGHPSHAAVLLFGQAPQRFLPASEVKCMHFHGTAVSKPIPSYQVYKGTAFELSDQALDFVLSKVARAVGTRAAGPAAPVEYELPREAVAEAIVNAIAHRDYTSHASVQVMLFADRLEIWNPGQLPAPLTIEQLSRPHASIPHNPLIAEPLFLARYIEKAGTGTLDMIALCKQAGLRVPVFRQDGGMFIQTLWRPKGATVPADLTMEGTKSGPSRDQVEILVKAGNGAALTDLMGVANRTNRTKFRDQVIKPLIEQGWLEMTIPDKPRSSQQKYRLTAKGEAWLSAHAAKGATKGP